MDVRDIYINREYYIYLTTYYEFYRSEMTVEAILTQSQTLSKQSIFSKFNQVVHANFGLKIID